MKIAKVYLIRNYWNSISLYQYFNIDYQQDSRVLYTFAANITFGQLLDISSKNFIFLKPLIYSFHYWI